MHRNPHPFELLLPILLLLLPSINAIPAFPLTPAQWLHPRDDYVCPSLVPYTETQPGATLKPKTVSASCNRDAGGQFIMNVKVHDGSEKDAVIAETSSVMPLNFNADGICWPDGSAGAGEFKVSSDKFRFDIHVRMCTPKTDLGEGRKPGFNMWYAVACWNQPWGGQYTRPGAVLQSINEGQSVPVRLWMLD